MEIKEYPGKLTPFVVLTCLIAATGGLIAGYGIGISGGVTSMDPFLKKFFPSVYRKEKQNQSSNQYCTFDSQILTTFTSSLYLAALVASFFASPVTRIFGRRWSMFAGGVSFLVGAALNGAAQDVFMLIFGRILLGIGVGFVGQSVPIYLSEMAPAKLRGMLNITCQLMVTIGIFSANLINYGISKIEAGWGWRLSLALAAVPATVITIGSLFLPDTPNSLIERGHDEKAKEILRKIRGTDDILEEYSDLVAAGKDSKQTRHPWINMVKRKYRPHLTMAILIPFFQQLTGINVIMFYAPVLFKTLGFSSNHSLMSVVIIGLVSMCAAFVSIGTVDRLGRRLLFLHGPTSSAAVLLAAVSSQPSDQISTVKFFRALQSGYMHGALSSIQIRSDGCDETAASSTAAEDVIPFLHGGFQMLACQIILGTLIAIKFGTTGEGTIPRTYAAFMVLFICIYVAGFEWSWGPLGGTLVPSEIFPLEIRSAGQSINVSVNMLFTFVVAQTFLPMLCHFKFGLFYFFAGWVIVMTIFIALFLPETKNVPLEKMILVWKAHWFWNKFIPDKNEQATI